MLAGSCRVELRLSLMSNVDGFEAVCAHDIVTMHIRGWWWCQGENGVSGYAGMIKSFAFQQAKSVSKSSVVGDCLAIIVGISV